MVTKIISGGQTGSDIAGLAAAKQLGIQTGGTAPKGFKTETGPNLELKELYGLIESSSSNYKLRTIENVKNSDGTVIFGDVSSVGSQLTVNTCIQLKKPHIINPSKLQLIDWINKKFISVLNCAGNRESVNQGIQERVKNFLILVFTSKEYNSLKEIK